MNILKKLSIGLVLFMSLTANGQNQYVLDLKPEKLNIKPEFYKFSEVIDERADKSNAGKVLSDKKSVAALFSTSLQMDLKKFIDESIIQDTSFIPIIISVEKFSLMETGSIKNHKLTLDYSLIFYRTISDKRYKLYEANGKPELMLGGSYSRAPETLIRESLKRVLLSFNEWINQNRDLPPLVNKVKVVFEKDEKTKTGDTIAWNENNKLKWSDFKGSPGNTGFMAQSNCIFSYKASTKKSDGIQNDGVMELHIRLFAGFDRLHSWVKPDQKKDTLLAHEQLHFDICELSVRNLRKRISDSVLNPMEYSKQINEIFDQVWNEYQEQQQRYDDEAKHGIIPDKQQMWQEEIAKDLKNTSDN